MSQKKKITRQELYKQVWEEPMTKLAKNFSISDVGLRKKCKSLNIPVPKQGYWQRKQFADPGSPPPLPPYNGSDEIEFKIQKKVWEGDPTRPVDKDQLRNAEEKIAFEKLPENQIKVTPILDLLHPLVKQSKKFLEKNTKNSALYNGLLSPGWKKCLDICVSPKNLNRALCIMNHLIREIEDREFKVLNIKEDINGQYSTKTIAQVLGENIEFGIRESTKQIKRKLTKEERRFWLGEKEFEYDLTPSGKLLLEIKEFCAYRKTWSDGKIQKVENCLNDFIVGLIRTSVELRTRKKENEIRVKERLVWEKKRFELAIKQQKEKDKIQELLDEAESWKKSQNIRRYINAVKESVEHEGQSLDPESDLEKWLIWAEQQADRLDPLSESPYSILDENI